MKKIETIAKHFKEIIKALGFDENEEHLIDTPNRVAKLFVNELFEGVDQKNIPKITTFDNPSIGNQELIFIKEIETYSICSHHFLPFSVKAHIAYIPNKVIAGLSKFSRVVKFFARKPQVQERLTKEIADYIEKELKPHAVAVHISGHHLCMSMRGIEERNAIMETSCLRGKFNLDNHLKNEFMHRIKKS